MRKNSNVIIIYNNRGVTLISLVVTIIIILIIAGITVGMITGENGLISETISSKDETEIKNIEEAVNRSYKYLQEESDYAFEDAVKELESDGYKIKITNNIDKEYYVYINGRYVQLIMEDGEIKVDRTY